MIFIKKKDTNGAKIIFSFLLLEHKASENIQLLFIITSRGDVFY